VEHAVLFAESNVILPCHLPKSIRAQVQEAEPSARLPDVGTRDEREHILCLLQSTRYNISRTAKLLGISRGTLYKKLKAYRISL
jgi:transcriptional regulator of acetoin/glycerol metabolism